MESPGIGFSDRSGDSSLRPGSVGFFDFGFGQDGNLSEFGGFEGKSEAGKSAADDEEI